MAIGSGLLLGWEAGQKVDVTPPWGRIIVVEGIEKNGTSYVDKNQITVQFEVADDTCDASRGEIMYHLSQAPISKETKLNASDWTTYDPTTPITVTLPEGVSEHTLYAAFKDKYGNVSVVYNGGYTITFDANGGTNAPVAQEIKYGMPITIPNVRPTYAGRYFLRMEHRQECDRKRI